MKSFSERSNEKLWDRQLGLYLEAAEKAAIIATTTDTAQRRAAEERFWVLYWGPLAAVEDVGLSKAETAAIESAMVKFGNLLTSVPKEESDREELKRNALDLAHAIRDAVAPAFNVELTDLRNLRT